MRTRELDEISPLLLILLLLLPLLLARPARREPEKITVKPVREVCPGITNARGRTNFVINPGLVRVIT